ncbi:MAG: BspA family leucine-rich repeat surface protein, partial [Erysipelotrichaceae bacterium]|nr:BspA family leucine-rich repeat surface protein [Erysipelotrichaceae bacterium]
VTDMGWMFQSCSSLTRLDLNKWDMSSVTTIQDMFHSCSSLTELLINEWKTSSITVMLKSRKKRFRRQKT